MIRQGIHSSAVIDCLGNVVIPESTIIEPLAVLYVGERGKLTLGEMNIIYPGATVRIDQGWMITGKNVSFGSGCHIYEPRAGLTIGDNSMIAGGVLICGVNHGYALRNVPMRQQTAESAPIVIGQDVWVGMGAIILPGVTLGEGCIVGAGAVVTADVPCGAVVVGVPARLAKYREL
jgi:acetyltransferase-like isoleucine patch superfamily enzyme